MVASGEVDQIGVKNFQAEEIKNSFQGIVAPVNIVSYEQIFWIRKLTTWVS